jgi:hypothetical protein
LAVDEEDSWVYGMKFDGEEAVKTVDAIKWQSLLL